MLFQDCPNMNSVSMRMTLEDLLEKVGTEAREPESAACDNALSVEP